MNFWNILFAKKNGHSGDYYDDLLALKLGVQVKTVSGSIVTFEDGSAMPVKSLVVDINAVQSGSGDPSPDNIRPISGWSTVNVVRTGFNQWDEKWEVGAFNPTTGAKEVNYVKIRSKNYIPIVPNTSYYYANLTTGISNYANVYFYDADKNYLGEIPNGVYAGTSTSNPNYQNPFTAPSNAYYMMFSVTNGYGTTYKNDICFNISGSHNGEYEPYNGTTYPISFGSTVYGGQLDVTSGMLNITHQIVDLGNLNWIAGACELENEYTMQTSGLQNLIVIPPTSGTPVDIICSIYKTQIGDRAFQGNLGVGVLRNGNISIYDPNYSSQSSPSAFKTAMAGQKLVYPLATPITTQLTPTEISTLLGQNNIWADSGDVEVTYIVR